MKNTEYPNTSSYAAIFLYIVRVKIITSHSAEEHKIETKDGVSISDILLTAMGDNMEENVVKDTLIFAAQQKELVGDISEESPGAITS